MLILRRALLAFVWLRRRCSICRLTWPRMPGLVAGLMLALLSPGWVLAAAGAPLPLIGPAPAWVLAPQSLDSLPPLSTTGAEGVHYLSLDQQVRVLASSFSRYRHVALRATHASGLGTVSHVEVQFNPEYQRLTLHHVTVRRGAQSIAKLRASAVQVLQRERELEYSILDGTKSANLFLDDVRVGDIVEYAYTLEGGNPVFGNMRFGRFDQQWAVPVERLRYRLLWPSDRPLQLRANNGASAPELFSRNGMEERIWQRQGVPGLKLEADVPAWYDPYPSVDWSEFESWGAVGRWALPLYPLQTPLGAELTRVRDSIMAQHARVEARVAAVLRLVQTEVRYLGVEVGVNSHAPQRPELVYRRRFGDCKDKALLMSTLLHSMGIEARPALVHSREGRSLDRMLASPAQFDHVVVRVRLEGRSYWLDPTRSTQYGPLKQIYQPDYGQALVVHPETVALEAMTPAQTQLNKREIAVFIDGQGGPGKPAQMRIDSVYSGLAAELMRADIVRQGREQMQKTYLNFYADLYPSAAVLEPLQIEDNQAANRIVLSERYTLPELWFTPAGKRRQQATLYSAELREFLKSAAQSRRQSPLQVGPPVDVSVRTELRLPMAWQEVKHSDLRIAGPGFEYVGRAQWPERDRVVLSDSFKSVVDHVSSADAKRHGDKIEEVRKALGYSVFYPSGAAGGWLEEMNWQVFLLALLGLGLLLRAALSVYRWDPAPAWNAGDFGARGLGGWLILLGLALGLGLVRLLASLLEVLPSYGASRWSELTVAGAAEYHALWAPLLLAELLFVLAALVFTTLALLLFFRRRSSFPAVMIVLAWGQAIWRLVDEWAVGTLPLTEAHAAASVSYKDDFLMLASCAIWTIYLSRSLRVRNTFVERLEAPLSASGQEPASSAA